MSWSLEYYASVRIKVQEATLIRAQKQRNEGKIITRMSTMAQYHLLNFVPHHPEVAKLVERSYCSIKAMRTAAKTAQTCLFRTLEINQRHATPKECWFKENGWTSARTEGLESFWLVLFPYPSPGGQVKHSYQITQRPHSWVNIPEKGKPVSAQSLYTGAQGSVIPKSHKVERGQMSTVDAWMHGISMPWDIIINQS